MPTKQIEDKSLWYGVVRTIVGVFVRLSYKKLQYVGRENIPTDGAVILAPNHCNALMDAFLVLYMCPKRKVFVARADLFNNKILKKILTFFKIMPINRVRDGLRSVQKTAETVQKSIRVLNNGVSFCILPEGTHRAMHSLLPIGKGIARVAYGANEQMGKERPIYILPIGLEYGDYFRLRSTAIVHIGKAINVTEYISANPQCSEHNLMQGIRKQVTDALRSLIVWIPDDENYPAVWESAKISSGEICPLSLEKRFSANRATAEKIQELQNQAPERASALFEKVNKFISERNKARISIKVFGAKNRLAAAIFSTLGVIITLPLFLALGIASSPIIITAEVAASKVKDRAFHNSFKCGIIAIVWFVIWVILAAVLLCTTPWYYAIGALLVLLPAPMITYDYFEMIRMCASRWKYLCNTPLKESYDEIRKLLKSI